MATNQSSSPSHSSQNAATPQLDFTHERGIDFDVPPLNYGEIRGDMSFPEAATTFDQWMSCPVSSGQERYRAVRTMRDNRTKLKALSKYFGRYKLQEITVRHLREFQKIRSSNEDGRWAHPAGAGKINAELGLLLRIMKLGSAYSRDIERYYLPFRAQESEIPKALSPDEQEHFLEVASSDPDWAIVYWYSLVAVHIAFSSDEMRTLRQGDINLTHQIIAVNRRHGKNKHRRREVPITDSRCMWALERLLERSYKLVGRSPDLHLFPARICRGNFDGSRHMGETGIRKQFEAVRDEAGLRWFKLNLWRHTAITRMAEAGVHIATIMARAGHCSPKMSAHYTHISMQAERMAMQRMTNGRRVTPQPPKRPKKTSAVDLMDPAIQAAIQAETARLVDLALKQEREPRYYPSSVKEEPAGPRLVMFPGENMN